MKNAFLRISCFSFQKANMISDNKDLRRELSELREQTDERFQIVFETLDQLLTVAVKEKKRLVNMGMRNEPWSQGTLAEKRVAPLKKGNKEGNKGGANCPHPYLPGKSCEQMQMHRALDDARLAGMIWIEMGKI